jgi:hypothetical protein
MQTTNASVTDGQTKKPWQTPQCTKKSWQTPRFVAIGLGDTKSGQGTFKETVTASGTS